VLITIAAEEGEELAGGGVDDVDHLLGPNFVGLCQRQKN
jgi:hypothetical protein